MIAATIQDQYATLIKRVKAGEKPESLGKDGFPVFAEDSLKTFQLLLSAYLKQVARQQSFWKINPEKWPAGKALIALSVAEKVQAIQAMLVRLLFWNQGQAERDAEDESNILNFDELMQLVEANRKGKSVKIEKLEREQPEDPIAFRTLIIQLMRAELPLSADDLASLVDFVTKQDFVEIWHTLPGETVLRAVETFATKSEIPASLHEPINGWRWAIRNRNRQHNKERQALDRLNALLGESRKKEFPIEPGEAWSDDALQTLKQLPAEQSQHWNTLLQHCKSAEASKPANKWLKRAAELIEPVSRERFKSNVSRWFGLVALPRPVHQPPRSHWQPDPDQLISDTNSRILKGLVWCCAGWKDDELSRALSGLAEVCFKKVRNLGPRCPRVGNACLYSLTSTSSNEAAAQLSRLDQKVKAHSARKLINKSLDKAAEATGQTREDLEEVSLPRYGLDAQGCLQQQLGAYTAELRITETNSTELIWRKADGNRQKSVPSEIKTRHGEELKKFQRTIKDLEKMLPAQKQRIERLLISERKWPFETWRERYLEHPLLAHLTRRLIWHFRHDERSALGIWHGGKFIDVKNAVLDWLSPEVQVRLWHPIGFEAKTVMQWRRWLEEHEVVQPFKQAHREIYVLTDAELRTGTYSNRFAAHIIKQHQFAALARQRGWQYALMGSFDFQSTPTLVLPQWGLSAEFFVEGAGDIGGRASMASSGVSLYLTTDQVRFLRNDGDEEQEGVELREVPAIVFSEVMRDADLFVGVCSVGNDPNWQDAGAVEGGGEYWQSYSFGALNATAATRKEVLERLVPRLKIASKCSFMDKFLVVKGSRRSYKIHLGSGNILMTPNDQYLCIVPNRGGVLENAREKLHLPFEGDTMLSIILSKAFLLAEDDKITDKTILSQIKNK